MYNSNSEYIDPTPFKPTEDVVMEGPKRPFKKKRRRIPDMNRLQEFTRAQVEPREPLDNPLIVKEEPVVLNAGDFRPNYLVDAPMEGAYLKNAVNPPENVTVGGDAVEDVEAPAEDVEIPVHENVGEREIELPQYKESFKETHKRLHPKPVRIKGSNGSKIQAGSPK